MTNKQLKIQELEAEIELNNMIIEDYSKDIFMEGWIAENKALKKRLAKLQTNDIKR